MRRHRSGWFPNNQFVPIKGVVPENVKDSVVRIVGLLGTQLHKGSGFFVAPDKIATNIHVVAHLGPIFAKLVDKETIWEVAGVTAYDVENDLVILKIAGEGLPLSLGDSDAVRRSEPISVVGFPEGVYKVMTGTVLSTRESDKRIRTTADTAGGSSGGPLPKQQRTGHWDSLLGETRLSLLMCSRDCSLRRHQWSH